MVHLIFIAHGCGNEKVTIVYKYLPTTKDHCQLDAFLQVFLAVNWFLFIWAVNNDHLLDASLGYYINPLFNVILGIMFFQERLRRNQLIAVALATFGVLIQLVTIGSLPLISLGLAGSFAVYGLLRKKLHVDSFVGLLVESLLMLPIALIYWLFFVDSSTSNMTLK